MATRTTARKRKVESFADWMARIDGEVEQMARSVSKKVPSWELLGSEQRRICEMVAEHLRSLPALADGENAFRKPEYGIVNRLLTDLYTARYPQWTRRKDGGLMVDDLPGKAGNEFSRLMYNCAGRRYPVADRSRESED